MSAYNVIIVDDDIKQARIVESMVLDHDSGVEFNIDICTSLQEFETRMKKGYSPQIVFMDIAFEGESSRGENGIDVARKLLADRHCVQLIYVTGHVEYCSRVYRTEHVYFLLKPVDENDFADALDKAIANLKARSMRPFGVKVGGRIIRVVPGDIEYIESDRRKVRIYTSDGVIEAYESLASIESKLPDIFVQCHKSFLVNMEKIVEMRSDGLDLASGATIPVSQKRSRETRAAFTKYLLERS